MSLRCIFCVLVIWAIGVNLANAQSDRLVRVTYPIGDLITPIQDHTAFPERLGAVAAPARPTAPDKNAERIARLLIELIRTTVARGTWEDNGGLGSLQYFPIGSAIVILHKQEVQEDVQMLLAALRRKHDFQVNVEMRVVSISGQAAERFLKDMNDAGTAIRPVGDRAGSPAKKPSRSVLAGELNAFMFLESAQGERAATVTQMPKVTMFNHQRVGVGNVTRLPTGEISAGIRCDFHPVVDAQRKNVRLLLDFESVTPGAETDGIRRREIANASATFNLPDGKTLIWHLGETASRHHQFLMVTPRVVVVREEDGVFMGKVEPIPGR